MAAVGKRHMKRVWRTWCLGALSSLLLLFPLHSAAAAERELGTVFYSPAERKEPF